MRTVLLIEDSPEIASILRLVISRTGHRALLASNLAEADKIWSAYKAEIELVVTDNALPDGSGIAFAESLVRERPGLKVIVASGMPGTNLPADFHRVDKPFDVAEFIAKFHQALAV